MLTKLAEGKLYKGRESTGNVCVNFSFDRETAAILDEVAPTKRGRSAYLARLLHAELARREERRKMQRFLDEAETVA
jgi:hypothetical protein